MADHCGQRVAYGADAIQDLLGLQRGDAAVGSVGTVVVQAEELTEKSLAAIKEMRPMAEGNVRFTKTLDEVEKRAKDKYFSRMGWMTQAHPVELPSGRILVPLYSDGYSYSIIAYTDDGGRTWSGSEPIVGVGSIQPSIVRKRDGTLVAYMRDNGPPPKRIMMSESADNGVTWSKVVDTSLPNPGAGAEAINLKDGGWLSSITTWRRGETHWPCRSRTMRARPGNGPGI